MHGAYSTALIAAGQGYLRDALRAMLVSMPDVTILEADDTPSAKDSLHKHHPDLVLIDGDLPGNHTMELVHAIQLEKPRARCAILANSFSQQAAAMKAGADRAPLKGEPAARLFAQVEQLLGATPQRLTAS